MSSAARDLNVVPLFTVVIPTRNREEPLRRTLRFLEAQTLDSAAYEVLVIDDGSARPIKYESRAEGPAVRVFHQSHGERSVARNQGAHEAKGQVLLFIDDDMLASRNLLEGHAAAHVEWPGALAIGAIRLPDEVLATPFGRFRSALETSGLPPARGPVARANFATAQNMSISRERFLALGGFETSVVSAEDQDLALRHTAAGGKIIYLPEAVAVHDDSVRGFRAYCRRTEWGAQNMAPFCRRHPDWQDNRERWDVNSPVSWRTDSPSRILRKTGKLFFGQRQPLAVLFAVIERLEAGAPSSRVLAKLYRLVLGIHLQRGFRRGWDGWAPSATGEGSKS